MVAMKTEDAPDKRAFVCQTLNPWGYPAKDRSGRLEMVEEAHLGKLLKKIKTSPAKKQISTPDFTGDSSATFNIKGAPNLSGVADAVATSPYFYRIVDIVDFLNDA